MSKVTMGEPPIRPHFWRHKNDGRIYVSGCMSLDTDTIPFVCLEDGRSYNYLEDKVEKFFELLPKGTSFSVEV